MKERDCFQLGAVPFKLKVFNMNLLRKPRILWIVCFDS